jgi:hypothetical protein
LWLERLQPVFFVAAIGSLGYQAWLVWHRPLAARTWGVKATLAASAAVNAVLITAWVVFAMRYR